MNEQKPQLSAEERRKQRLAEALRDNLKRRKQQARQRDSLDAPARAQALPQSGHGGVIGDKVQDTSES